MARTIPITSNGAGLIAWRPALGAGLIGVLVFLLLQMLGVAIFAGESPWTPIAMIAAIVMGQGALEPPLAFHAATLVTAVIVHFALAMVFGVMLAFLLYRWHAGIWRWSPTPPWARSSAGSCTR